MLIRNEISSFLTEMFKSMIVTFSLKGGGGGEKSIFKFSKPLLHAAQKYGCWGNLASALWVLQVSWVVYLFQAGLYLDC